MRPNHNFTSLFFRSALDNGQWLQNAKSASKDCILIDVFEDHIYKRIARPEHGRTQLIHLLIGGCPILGLTSMQQF